MKKDFGIMSTADLHGVRVATILILFWVGVWNLAEECIQYIHINYNIPRWKINMTMVLLVLLIIILDPYTFEKL
jgi:predicted membrane protein